jgi:hypothetical protein
MSRFTGRAREHEGKIDCILMCQMRGFRQRNRIIILYCVLSERTEDDQEYSLEYMHRNRSIYGKLRGMHPSIYQESIADMAHDTTI